MTLLLIFCRSQQVLYLVHKRWDLRSEKRTYFQLNSQFAEFRLYREQERGIIQAMFLSDSLGNVFDASAQQISMSESFR